MAQPHSSSIPPRDSPSLLIIGAGPAGLALAYELRKRQIPFLILEQGKQAGESWHQMPAHLRLISPWKTNALPGTRPKLFGRHQSLTRSEFANYLGDYAQQHHLPIQYQTTVRSLTRNPNGEFWLQTSHGQFACRRVVNASGYFSHPHTPLIPGANATSIPQLHFADYRSGAQVRQIIAKPSGHILVVGKRLSAGQLIQELRGEGHEVSVSHRSPIRFGAGPLGWWFFYRAFPWLERFQLLLRGNHVGPVDVRMPGGVLKAWIQSGQIQCFPEIHRFEKDSVRFAGASSMQPDLVIYATGFRPALSHLQSLELDLNQELALDGRTGNPILNEFGFESASVPGLYFLGLDGQQNFRSRFLRGIREDAALLADLLQRPFHGPCIPESLTKANQEPTLSPPTRSESILMR